MKKFAYIPQPTPPTYPARPMNGGDLNIAGPFDDDEDWRYRPKFNGRRVLFHVPTMRTWNRQLEENSWSKFPVFKAIQDIIGTCDLFRGAFLEPLLEWLDVELLHGKTTIAKKSVVVLDYVSEETWLERQHKLIEVFGANPLSIYETPGDNEVYYSVPFVVKGGLQTWADLQEANTNLGCTFYEGLVAYNKRKPYPTQLFSPTKETPHWFKYKWP